MKLNLPSRPATVHLDSQIIARMVRPELKALKEVVNGVAKTPTRTTPVFHRSPPAPLQERLALVLTQAHARDASFSKDLAYFESFFTIACTKDDAWRLLDALTKSKDVAEVYEAGETSAPYLKITSLDRPQPQHHLDPKPVGVGATYAWNRPGGRGEGVRFVDLEVGWNLDYGSLVEGAITLVAGRPVAATDSRRHGTSVLGVVAGVDFPQNLFGIARSITSARVASVINEERLTDIAGTIVRAIEELRFGDVLLIEEEDVGHIAVEIEPAIFAAIRLATARGIVVITPAGNGGKDLGLVSSLDRKHSDSRPLDPSASGFEDSGAIVVGGSRSALSGPTHLRQEESNYGDRVDCYAWAEEVVTSGYGPPPGEVLVNARSHEEEQPELIGGADLSDSVDFFTVRPGIGYVKFDGTSAASAIIAGVAAVIQSLAQVHLGFRLSPWQIRLVLADPQNGTPSAMTGANRIGSMPDLKAIIEQVLFPSPESVAQQIDAVPQASTVVTHAVETKPSSPGAHLVLAFDTFAPNLTGLMRLEVISGLPRSAQAWLDMPPALSDLAGIWGDPPVEPVPGNVYTRINPLGKSYFRAREFHATTSYSLRLVIFVPAEDRGKTFRIAVRQLRLGWANDAEVWRKIWSIVPREHI